MNFIQNIAVTSNSPIGPVTDVDGTTNEVVENPAAATLVGIMATATDSDVGDTVTYSLTNNAGGRFEIDPLTGVVRVAATAPAIDREADASFTIEVTATSTDTSTSVQTFNVNVSPVNDNDPVITSDDGGATAGINVAENTTAVTTVTATDANDQSVSQTFTINLSESSQNTPPFLSDIPTDFTAMAGSTFEFQLSATDIENDELIYEVDVVSPSSAAMYP